LGNQIRQSSIAQLSPTASRPTIGGAGNIGSEVAKELLKRKLQVDVLVRKEDVQVPEGARAVTGDLLDPVSVCMS
jgi:nucleoside-diphosphate-sugar epimerase